MAYSRVIKILKVVIFYVIYNTSNRGSPLEYYLKKKNKEQTNTLHRKLKIELQTPIKCGCELRCSGSRQTESIDGRHIRLDGQ